MLAPVFVIDQLDFSHYSTRERLRIEFLKSDVAFDRFAIICGSLEFGDLTYPRSDGDVGSHGALNPGL